MCKRKCPAKETACMVVLGLKRATGFWRARKTKLGPSSRDELEMSRDGSEGQIGHSKEDRGSQVRGSHRQT